MKMWSVLSLALCVMLSMVACSKPGEDTSAPKDEAAAPVTETAPATVPAADAAPAAPATAPAADAAPATPAAAGATGLEGSTWKLGDFMITFKDATKLNVKGGPVPDGIDGDYKVDNGAITINVLTQTKTGTWDGTTLIVDGKTAEKQS